jgi:hypothetical protein
MADATSQHGPHDGARVCALKYREHGSTPISTNGQVVFLAVMAGAQLSLYMHRRLMDLVDPSDQVFITEFVRDVMRRSEKEALEVFRELWSLNFGPIFCDSAYSSESGLGAIDPEFRLVLTQNEFGKRVKSSRRATE